MEKLFNKVKLYLEANGKVHKDEKNNIILQNDSDGRGNYIHTWNVSGLVKPTDEQLNSYSSQANTAESNSIVDGTRRTAYGSWNEQLDEIYHNIDAWKARIKSIKDANAKE